ncbi:DUF3343 domain-containing protein [Clostridium akagii]|uniref:DUF3343 domain-containing protein n=1 Tax=Clostridium akagii TaxID=91623 RepID=UPI00055B20C8|nr:DUF3343 domain-containing protein [Clostridium akagii]
MGEKYIMVFVSSSQAAYIYNELEKNSISVELVSTPAEILSGCTKSIIYNKGHNDIVMGEVAKINAKTKGIYSIENDNKYIKI